MSNNQEYIQSELPALKLFKRWATNTTKEPLRINKHDTE